MDHTNMHVTPPASPPNIGTVQAMAERKKCFGPSRQLRSTPPPRGHMEPMTLVLPPPAAVNAGQSEPLELPPAAINAAFPVNMVVFSGDNN